MNHTKLKARHEKFLKGNFGTIESGVQYWEITMGFHVSVFITALYMLLICQKEGTLSHTKFHKQNKNSDMLLGDSQ